METRALSESSAFIVMASDGVFEFLSSQSVVDMVRVRPTPLPVHIFPHIYTAKSWCGPSCAGLACHRERPMHAYRAGVQV